MKGQEHIARLLAADLLGLQIFDPHQQQFRFHPGPVFTQVLPADENNRASPKVQSALLEAMAEGKVSTEGCPHPLRSPFFVIATQHPADQAGTYPLPLPSRCSAIATGPCSTCCAGATPPLSPRQRQRIWQQLQRRLRQTCRAWDGQR